MQPGPGLPEACLWTVGCQLTQLVALVALVVLLVWCATDVFPPTLEATSRIAVLLDWESSFLLTGVASLSALLLIVPAVRWRIGRGWRREFGLRRLTLAEGVLIAAAVAPLGVLSHQVYRWGRQLTSLLVDRWPELAALQQFDVMQVVQRQTETTPYPVLLVAIAIAPAVSEEFVFRGLIGRGLMARWGAWAGVGLTSLLFAVAHGAPAHALATLLVAFALHYVYLATGNLWGAVLLHGLLNGLSVTLMKLQPDLSLPASPALLWAAVGYLAVVAGLLHEHARRASPVAPNAADGVVADLVSTAPERPLRGVGPRLAACSILAYTYVFVWTNVAAL